MQLYAYDQSFVDEIFTGDSARKTVIVGTN